MKPYLPLRRRIRRAQQQSTNAGFTGDVTVLKETSMSRTWFSMLADRVGGRRRSISRAAFERQTRNLICRRQIVTAELVRMYPPLLFSANKKLVYGIACPEGCEHGGQIVFSRWRAVPYPQSFAARAGSTRFVMLEDTHQYGSATSDKRRRTVEWYVNFADRDLFCAYGSSLFAQDEIQVAEHPALGSLKEMLTALASDSADFRPQTRDEDGNPTPILIRGVERRVAISVEPNPKEGRPDGLYGNAFGRAAKDAIRAASRALDPPTTTNLIAMEAPKGGVGKYSLEEIDDVFRTACTAFSAASLESRVAAGRHARATIHTGNWGTGAYGGNRVLMALLQLAAAKAAGIDRLVYHTFSRQFSDAYQQAMELFVANLEEVAHPVCVQDFLDRVHGMDFQWGVSDGN